jgi:DNA-binding transcriptional regulator YiaG
MATASLLATAKVRRLAASGQARRIRERANVSLTQAAAEIRVAKSTLCRWELGERLPRGGDAAERWLALLVLLAEFSVDSEAA